MTLLIDIGNSKLAAAVWSGTRVGPVERVDRSQAVDPVDAVWRWCLAQDASRLVVTSVVPADTDRLRELAEGYPVLVIDHRSDFPFQVSVESPETVGSDRYCNMAGAWFDGAQDAIVADLGSANTYDVLRGGVFVGGLIAPGIGIAHQALIERGAQLPAVPLDDPGVLIGTHTRQALAAGGYHQGVAGVLGVIQSLRHELPQARVLVTGGAAALVGPSLPAEAQLRPHLTLEGAARLAEASGFLA